MGQRLKWFATGMVAGIGVYYGYKKISENMDLIISFIDDEELIIADEIDDIPVHSAEVEEELPEEDIVVADKVLASYEDVTMALNKLRNKFKFENNQTIEQTFSSIMLYDSITAVLNKYGKQCGSENDPTKEQNQTYRILSIMLENIITYIDIQRKHLRIIFEEGTEEGVYNEVVAVFKDYLQYYKLLGLAYNTFDVDPLGLLKTDIPDYIFESIKDYLNELPGFNRESPDNSAIEASELHNEIISKLEILLAN